MVKVDLSGAEQFFTGAGPAVSQRAQMPTTGEDNGNAAYIQENQQLEELKKELDEYISQNNLDEELSTQLVEEGLMIRIREKALFASGSADLQNDSEKIGPAVATLLASIPQRVIISGHTDNVPIANSRFPSNWELSSTRALTFMKFLLNTNNTLNPARFSAIGYSEYRPIADNNTDEGKTQNRRVEILIARSQTFDPHEAERVAKAEAEAENIISFP